MRIILLVLLLIPGPALLAAPAARAREMRFPEKGLPAFVFTLPDDWTAHAVDARNMILASANRATNVVILVNESSQPLDDIARDAFVAARAAPMQGKQGVSIAGCPGFIYYSNMKDARGRRMVLEMTIVQADRNHIVASTLIIGSGVNPVDESTARQVQNGLKLRVSP